VCLQVIGLCLRGGAPNPDLFTGDEDEDDDAGKSPEGLYLSNINMTGYKGVVKQTNSETFYLRKQNRLIYGFTTAFEAAQMYKRIVDGDVTFEEAKEEVAKEAEKKKEEAEKKREKAKLETKKKELEAKLEEIYEKLAALE